MRTFLLGCAALCVLGAWTGQAMAEEDLGAVLEKAIQAHNQEADSKHKDRATYTKSKGTIAMIGEIPFREEGFHQPPDKSKKVTHMTLNGQKGEFIILANGNKVWMGFAGRYRELDKTEIADAKNPSEVQDFRALKKRKADLAALGEIRIDGRPAVGMKVTKTDREDVDLYFDKESGFLVKIVTHKTYPESGKRFVEEKIFSDYQDTDGHKWPRKMVCNRDGKQFMTKEVLEFKFVEKYDDGVFAKP